tara:strand:+ start:1815 stop:2075 length:261 start_codon:yes stop_codon:yes gene_type:complete
MKNYNDETPLEMVELYAEEMGYIASESELSEQFDSMFTEDPAMKEKLSNDEPMLSEAFSNWSDVLCKDGEIHPLQYSEYCYCGDLS